MPAHAPRSLLLTLVLSSLLAIEPAQAVTPDDTLHQSVYRGDADAVRRLLRDGAPADSRTDTGMTPLAVAALMGDATLIGMLLEAGAGVNETLVNGETPLMLAARHGDVDALQRLIDAGAELDLREKLRGTTALMWAAANRHPDALRALLKAGADPDLRSATVEPGRRPYLAPPARERIQEFIDGTGLRGAAVGLEDPAARARFERQVTAAKLQVARFADPAPWQKRDGTRWGGLTALHFAARENDPASVQALIDAGVDVNQQSEFGWTALLAATQNRAYQLGAWLLEQGADPNLANHGGWNALYLATDNRNIEGGDYPTRRPDLDHLDYIRRLLDAGANPDLRMRSSTETRTIFTNQWLNEEGATPFLRAAQSGDVELMRLLLAHGADPHLATDHAVTPLMVAAGIGWVEGVTFEWSAARSLEAMRMLLDLGADVNAQDVLDGRTALMGAAHKGRTDVISLLVERGADLSLRDIGSRDSIHAMAGKAWLAVDYADGLVRVGVQSPEAKPEAATLLRSLMRRQGLPVPPEGRTLDTLCVLEHCN